MNVSILYYFVDTNLFFQCRSLEQLDWSPWNMFDEVRLIVSNPVLREIDYRKNKSNDRVGKRARNTSAMFREIRSTGEKLVHASSPRVFLSIEPHHTYSQSLAGQLNYQERDDQLVGTVFKFMQHNQTSDVRLLTHDTTPLFVAQGLKLTADMIPDDWLLPPEITETEKRLQSLEIENARLRKAEPSFSIRFLDQTDTEAERYQASYTWFDPLTDTEVDELMQCLKDRFPLETDFGSREPAERSNPPTVNNLFLGTRRRFAPATDEEIKKYRDIDYPQWLDDCEKTLRNHHWSLQRASKALSFSFIAMNRGTRPATDALITITAKGDFQVTVPSVDNWDNRQDAEADESEDLRGEALREPPVAPHGHWQSIGGINLDSLDVHALARSVSSILDTTRSISGIGKYGPLASLPQNPKPRDANSFYYKADRPSIPLDSFSIECEQWRHGDGDEDFVGELHVLSKHADVEGALLCRIHASNLSTPELKTIPVRVAVAYVSVRESTQRMVEGLLKKPIQTSRS